MANLEEDIPKHWSWGRVVLAGDACHKYTPNAGLGLNDGIQDIVLLCNGLCRTIKDTPDGLDTATLRWVFDEYQDIRSKPLQKDAELSAQVTHMHAWANTFYHVTACYIMLWELVQESFINYSAAQYIKRGRVLDYISATEPFKGIVNWVHQMKS
jgi:2-polyprenyl-6-methoxyphenol hydroxylase-like FAD-dependent oxidoreductase